jgi:hypothetical protein
MKFQREGVSADDGQVLTTKHTSGVCRDMTMLFSGVWPNRIVPGYFKAFDVGC